MERGKLISLKPQAQRPSNLQIINPTTYPNWNELVLSHPKYSFFHSSNWARVLAESYNYNPVYFMAVDEKGLAYLIPFMEIKSFITGKRAVSLPFSDYCEPFIADGYDLQDVMSYIRKWGMKSGWEYVEIRGCEDFIEDVPVSSSYYGHVLNLSRDEEKIFSSFNNSNKRNIRNAVKRGVEIRVSNSLESIKVFYRLNCITRRRHGLPPQPYSFFKNIFAHVISQNHGKVVFANFEDQTIAGAVYFHFGKKVVFKYGASDSAYQHLRANNLVMWKAIKYYCNRGYEQLFFGRTDLEHEGLRQFKSGWGAEENIIKYYKLDIQKDIFVKTKSGISDFKKSILGKMPVPVLKYIGSMLYRHTG